MSIQRFSGSRLRAAKFVPKHRFRPMLDGLDSRLLLTGISASYAVQSVWSTGYQAQLALNNSDLTPVNNWKLDFDLATNITSIWDAQILSHTGNHYQIAGLSYDNSIGANSTLAFGFNAATTAAGGTSTPTNYTLNGIALGQTGATAPAISVTDVTANVGSAASTNATFTLTLSKSATTPVTVAYATADATAKAGIDYTSKTGTVTFAVGQTSQTVAIAVPAAANWQADKSFAINFTNPTGATLARTQAFGTIHNLNTPPASGSVTFKVTSDWGLAFNGEIDIQNSGTTSVTNWTLDFDLAGQISSIWNASISSHVGNHYKIIPASWNTSISPGTTAAIGFTAGPGGGTIAPINFVLTPPVSGGIGGSTKSPVAVADSASLYQGQIASIAVLANDTDPNGLAMTISTTTKPLHGSIVVNVDKTITYTPTSTYLGSDTFNYTITDALGGTSTAAVTLTVLAPPSAPTWSAHEYSPYVDMTLYPTYSLVDAAKTAGIKNFTLAFVVADPSNKPAWGGYAANEINGTDFDKAMAQQINGLRAIGGDVMVSFGGASNQELAQVITDPVALKNAYESVINAYNLTHIDFDIEGGASADRVSIDRRSQAIAMVQQDMAAANRPLEVWYTLPVLPTGLTNDGLYVLQSALKSGVNIGGVNIMAMDFGESAAPNPAGQMGTYAIQSGTSLFNQLRNLYGSAPTDAQLWAKVGITPMIGMNDDTLEIFDQAAAQQVVTWAKSKGIGRISMWSLNRDQQNAAGKLTYVDLKSSSLIQQPYEFSKIFGTFVS
jgi:hypothetical protein